MFFVLLCIFCFSITAKSQTWTLEVNGSVQKDNKKLEGAVVTLYKDSFQVRQIITASDGKFQFNLEPGNDYFISFAKAGHLTKQVVFSTKKVPQERWKQGFTPFKFDISIFEITEGVDISLLNQPIAKIDFDAKEGDFTYDTGYTHSIRDLLAKMKKAEQAAKKYNSAK